MKTQNGNHLNVVILNGALSVILISCLNDVPTLNQNNVNVIHIGMYPRTKEKVLVWKTQLYISTINYKLLVIAYLFRYIPTRLMTGR